MTSWESLGYFYAATLKWGDDIQWDHLEIEEKDSTIWTGLSAHQHSINETGRRLLTWGYLQVVESLCCHPWIQSQQPNFYFCFLLLWSFRLQEKCIFCFLCALGFMGSISPGESLHMSWPQVSIYVLVKKIPSQEVVFPTKQNLGMYVVIRSWVKLNYFT